MSNQVLNLYRRLEGYPGGRWLFSRIVCLRAPYFGTIGPQFVELKPGRSHVAMKKRRSVQNHLGGVHALAMGNLCELAAGLLTEVSIPENLRWIPRGMTIRYLRQARSAVDAVATFPELTSHDKQDVVVSVSVRDADGDEVVAADITMYVSPKRSEEKEL